MDRLSKSVFIISLILSLAIQTSFAQNKSTVKSKSIDYIKISDESGKKYDFVFKSTAKFEIQNGVLNISVLSVNNTLLEINGINEKIIKDTVLSDASFKVMYIISQNEKAFISNPVNSNSNLTIKCSKVKNGNPINVLIQGKLFRDGKNILLDAKLSGKIPEVKNTTTRKIN